MKKLLCIIALILILSFAFASCGKKDDGNEPATPTVSISEDGYVVVNGVKTEYKIDTNDTVTVNSDGYVVVNGVVTTIVAGKDDVVTVDADGFIVVNGTKTEHKVHISDNVSISDDGYVVVNGIKTDYLISAKHTHILENDICTICGRMNSTEGLIFKLNSDGCGYTLLSCEEVTAKEIVVDLYKGLPITAVEDDVLHNLNLDKLTIGKDVDFYSGLSSSNTFQGSSIKTIILNNNGAYICNVENLQEIYISGQRNTVCVESYDCNNLEKIVCEEGILSLDLSTDSTHIKTISIPNSLAYAFISAPTPSENEVYGHSEYENGYYLGNETNPYLYLSHVRSDATAITTHSSTRILGGYVFRNSSVETLSLNQGLQYIAYAAFYGAEFLESITLPSSIRNIEGERLFYGCSSLENIAINGENERYFVKGNCIIEKETKTLIAACKASFIPTDSTVTTIGNSAFEGITALTEITIPSNIKRIGEDAFYGCNSLTKVIINEGTTVIKWSAFDGCTNLTSITIPKSVTTIEYYAFVGCSKLTDVYYTGTEDDWSKIKIEGYNDSMTRANIHYNYVIEA